MQRLTPCFVRIAFVWSALSGLPLLQHRTVNAQESTAAQAEVIEQTPIPPARAKYMGRMIAQTMSFHGAPWLIRETREQEERPSEVLKQLQLKPGLTVCDLGCGNGFYALLMAAQVGETGQVLAVDIQPEMLHLLELRCEQAGVENVKPVLGTVVDPNLPQNKVDLVLLVDVYHEFSHPALMLRNIRDSLSDTGVIALLEYREEDRTVPIKPLHKMSKRQIVKEYSANGLRVARQYDGLPWQHLMFFERDPTWTPKNYSAPDDE
ncbi:class I SAM-dependent methyltransferase [Aureliella helgolandensis]|uniref:Demethylmenaquinone methyltransferase n=1 Tax=Aureliella helgolandensis TaxID=2527968 RepID=A0A518GC34_9BACT|nr:class I SAM-dependent methyltransferase [Aureliella helgolandensis]QDV26166.1 Demethylmenaquinone methyltransferase [Aureliella helgolandensis]